jgi:hypothetical protein
MEIVMQKMVAIVAFTLATLSAGFAAATPVSYAVDQKLHDMATSGPVVLTPDLSKLNVVGLTPDIAPMCR